MADPKDVTFELNVFGEEPRCHLKLTGPGTPPLEFVVSAFKRLDDAQKLWQETHAPTQEPDEWPPDEPETAPTEPPVQQGNRPPGGATDAQCKKILAVCRKVDAAMVTKLIENYPSVEYRYDVEGHCIPEWDFLQSLKKHQASTIIERLERAEA